MSNDKLNNYIEQQKKAIQKLKTLNSNTDNFILSVNKMTKNK